MRSGIIDLTMTIGLLLLWIINVLVFGDNLLVVAAESPDLSSSGSRKTITQHHAQSSIGEYFDEIGFEQRISTADSPLLSLRSKFQKIEIYQSKYYGKILVLDGVLQITEVDANAYNEMLSHVPLFQHANPKRVLILGGGDGYVLSEVLKHESVEHVDHVDLDGDVIDVCKKHFPWGKAWSDKRVKLTIADGAAFARDSPDENYDVIIQDSSDPWSTDGETLPSGALYEEDHFKHLHRILKVDGILNIQAESFAIPADLAGISRWRNRALATGFETAKYGSLYISSYPTGQIGFLLCEKLPSRAARSKDVLSRYQLMVQAGRLTSYFHPPLMKSSFVLPLWVHKRIYGTKHPSGSVCAEDEKDEDIQ